MVPTSPCLRDEELVAISEDRLGLEGMRRLYQHLATCGACRALVAGLLEGDPGDSVLEGSTAPRLDAPEDAVPDPDSWTPPPRFEEFQVRAPLGQGAMGQVFTAHDVVLDRPVAVKFITSLGQEEKERFVIEARAIARLNHPNVVTLYRVGELDGHPYLVSELISGESLNHLRVPIPWRRALELGVELAAGLAEAHRCGVLHRDIKPANVILSKNGAVKLLDFGLARLSHAPVVDRRRGGAVAAQPTLTRTGALIGTPLYMSPEAWSSVDPIPQMDVYSLGALLYQLCTGRPPHEDSNVLRLGWKVVNQDAAGLETLVLGVDAGFAQVVMRCLQRDPAARFASAVELLESLRAVSRSIEAGQIEAALAEAPTLIGAWPHALGPAPPRRAGTRVFAHAVLRYCGVALVGALALLGGMKLLGGADRRGALVASEDGPGGGRVDTRRPAQVVVVVLAAPPPGYQASGEAALAIQPVSIEQFRRYAEQANLQHPAGGKWAWRLPRPPRPESPMLQMTRVQAGGYCAWQTVGGRLPTRAEWDRAAPHLAPGQYPELVADEPEKGLRQFRCAVDLTRKELLP